jgi:hypothetical protein
MRRLVMLVIALMFVGVQIPAVLAQEATPPAASPPSMDEFVQQIQQGQVCAWPVEVGVDALNVAFPDPNNAYFVLPYILGPGQSFVVKGTFPFDRFTSIVTYYRDLSGLGSGLELLGWMPDYAIIPDPGSTNPAVDPNASTDPAQRQWTLRVTGTASTSATPVAAMPVDGQNVLPAMPEGVDNVIGVLAMRIYVPNDAADHTGGVGLPAISIEDGSGASRTLTECTAADRETWKAFFTPFAIQIIQEAPQLPLPAGPDAPLQWTQTTFPGLGTNPDARYLMVPFAWEPGRIVVIRGQAPTFPDTRAGESVIGQYDVRYWSFGTGANVIPLISGPSPIAGDFQIATTSDGTYTVIVSQPEDQPANATAENGVTWIQGADPSQPSLLWLRQLLPSKDYYNQSVWAVPEGVVGAAEQIMGPYYPQITYCDTATFETGGADACFAASGSATPAG